MHFKTIEDYINAATSHGFEIVDFTEAKVRAEDMVSNVPFFSSVNGYPLHMVIKLRKPMSTNDSASLGSMNTLDLLPIKLNWPRTVTNNVENPAKIYSNEGIAQFLFFKSDTQPETTYKSKNGKYQGQTTIQVAKIKK